MLQSIKANNGFFVGRYEVGSFDNPITSNDVTRKSVIQKGAYPYNYVTVSQAQELSEALVPEKGITSSLMFGIQWNLVMKYLETKGVPESELKTNSSSWGNYRNVEFSIEEGNKYAIATNWILGEWNNVPENYMKQIFDIDGDGILLTTGATERNSKINIYDLAGNVWEWTLERTPEVSGPCVLRGGYYSGDGYIISASFHNDSGSSLNGSTVGFRPALY